MKIVAQEDNTGVAPAGCRWSAIDEDSYDGAPDSRSNQIGFGPTQDAAIADLQAQRIDAIEERTKPPAISRTDFFRLIEEGGMPWQHFPVDKRRSALEAFREAVARGNYCHLLLFAAACQTQSVAKFPGMWSAGDTT